MNHINKDKVIDYIIDPNAYQPIIVGQIDELVVRLDVLQPQFPKLSEVFRGILITHSSRHPLLEDWLIINIYLFIWEGVSDKLRWIEDLFNELASAIGQQAWLDLVQEIVCQTNCITTQKIYDRIYDYFLHMYGALYLIRQKWSIRVLSMIEPGPDIEASRGSELCVMECKFKHTSRKMESFFWRFDSACRKFKEKKPFIVSDQFRFPGAESMKELLPSHCIALKAFIGNTYLFSNEIIKGNFEDLKFEFYPSLRLATTIDSQENVADSSAMSFFEGNLSKLLEGAAEQLGDINYKNYQKLLFIGLQPDPFFLLPWTEPAIQKIKNLLSMKAQNTFGVTVIFSEDVGFSVGRYI